MYYATDTNVIKSMKNLGVGQPLSRRESSILMITPKPKDYTQFTSVRRNSSKGQSSATLAARRPQIGLGKARSIKVRRGREGGVKV